MGIPISLLMLPVTILKHLLRKFIGNENNMNNLTSSQRRSAKEFMSFTQTNEKTAINVLTVYNWNVQVAVDRYYQDPQAYQQHEGPVKSTSSNTNNAKLESLYKKYRDPSETDKITTEGVIKLFEDLEVDTTNETALILSWIWNAKTQGEFTKEEFIEGMKNMKCDSIEKLKSRMKSLDNEIRDKESYQKYYKFVYNFAKADPQQKVLEVQTAIAYWRLILGKKRFHFLDTWTTFVEEHHKKSISKDQWNSLLDFANTVKDDLENFDENGAWPAIFDDFVEFAKEKCE